MSVKADRARVARAAGHEVCPYCGRPVIEARMTTSGGLIRLDPQPAAIGNLELDEMGGARFIPPAYRDPKSRWFVPPEQRFTSHRSTCPNNERALAAGDASFIGRVERRLQAVRP